MDNFECDLLDNIRADSREERVMEVDELVEAELLQEPNVDGPAVANFSCNRPEASHAVDDQRAKAASVATGHHAKAQANGADKGQNAVSLMDKRHAALEQVCQMAHLAESMEPTTHEHAANSGDVRFQQADATRLAAAQRDAREAKEGLRMCQEESMTLKYKVRMLEEQLEQRCKLLREAEDAAAQNNLVRKCENFKIQPQLNDTVQTMNECSPVGRPRHPLSGYQGKPFVRKKEVPRRYYEETEEILDESERYGRYGVVQEDERSPVRFNSAARHEDTELFSQFLITQSIPEPPVFSAAPGKLSISIFAKTFKMIFGTLSREFQITLLETKYLEGKALKVFKVIPLDEKTTVEATLKAMVLRLRVSVEDESRKAKTKWEALRRLDGQSIEDFCLQLDEIARVAFSRTPPEELSSLSSKSTGGTDPSSRETVDVERESVILGTNAFDIMGISMNIQGAPREIKLTQDIRLVPGSGKTVEVIVEGVVEEQGDCLMTPLVESLASAICKVNRDGKAVLRFFNFGETSILLRKGQIVATGEVEGFDIVQEDVEDQRWGEELNERVGSPEFKAPNGHVCSVEGETYAGMQKFSDLCVPASSRTRRRESRN
uniref:Uncharacterized protein n=1 Tax=Caenorhabditis japonica TaxID=281687 RepID=A0A8R1EGH7_CAEJA